MSRLFTGAALYMAAAWALDAQAAVVQLAPIPIEVQGPQATAILSVSNRATSEVTLQVRGFRWRQENGEDRLAPDEALAVSPPIATVPAGQTLSVRIVRLSNVPVAAEESYRIWVDELPTEKGKTQSSNLRILTRYSVPAFFEPAGAPGDEPLLYWTLARQNNGLRLTATNKGLRRVRLSELQLRTANGKTAAGEGAGETGYVLAGQSMSWDLAPNKDFSVAPGAYRVDYQTEARAHHESVTLAR